MKKFLLIVAVVLFTATFSQAQTYLYNTIAGTIFTQGYNGDNIAATTAELFGPEGVAVDASGNIYIADQNNNRIRKVNTSAIISTVAGNGAFGFSGDNLAATVAELDGPNGVTKDASGNIYIADESNNRVRKISTAGIITTIAGNGGQGYSGDGGAATATELNQPTGVAVDASGNVYIADYDNSRIRKVSTSGIITTIAGNGTAGYSGDNIAATAAELYFPQAVAVDASGNLYIADYTNMRIRKVNTSGTIFTVAGNGYGAGNTGSYSGDGGAATSAELDFPTGVAVDASGNLYIADNQNNRIRYVNTGGIISTIAGTGVLALSGNNEVATAAAIEHPNGVAVDASGNIYIAIPFPFNCIGKLTPYTCTLTEGPPTVNQNISCYATNTGKITAATPSGGTTPYTYSWSGGGGTNSTASALSAGTYTLTVSDKVGCSAIVSATITQPAPWYTDITSITYPSCNGGTGTLAATLGAVTTKTFSYEAAVQHFTVPAGVTSVTVTVTGARGAYGANNTQYGSGASFSGICQVTPAHVISIVAGGIGGQASDINEAGGGGGGSYVYDSTVLGAHTGTPSLSALLAVAGGGGGGGATVSGASGGTDMVTNLTTASSSSAAGGTGGNGGSAGVAGCYNGGAAGAGWIGNGASGTIGGSDANIVSNGGSDWANNFSGGAVNAPGSGDNGGYGGGGGASVYAAGGGGGYNGGGGGNDFCGGFEGGGGGGGSYLNGTVVGTPTATNTGAGQVVISYQAVGAQGGASPYTYSWTGGGGTANTATGLTAGTYTLTITDNHGCSLTSSATLTQPTLVGITVSSVINVSCNGGTGSATANAATGGTSPYTYSWSGGGGTSLNSTILTSGVYTIKVTDNHGCSASASATITQPAVGLGGATISSVMNVSCVGGSGSITANVATGGTSPYTYSWSGGGGTNLTTVSLLAGTYTITVKDNHGCTISVSSTITQPASALGITISSVNNISCNGSTGNATANAANGGTSPYTYSWSGGGGTALTALNLSVGTYSIMVTDNHGCTAAASVAITEPTPIGIETYTITTIAGSASSAYNGDNLTATSAAIAPYDVAVDGAGNMYIADYDNSRVRKVNTSGILTTIAGNANFGYNGDNIAATSADLYGPTGVAVDDSGNVYFADYLNQRIRKVNTNGIISTIAGTGTPGYNGDNIPATSAELNYALQVKVDGSGNVYIADASNNRIRKINSSGIITTVAGTGNSSYNGENIAATSANISEPLAVGLDSYGNVYIAENNTNRVRMVNTSGIISTLTGNGTGGYNGDNIAATSAEISGPQGVAVDGSGNIYIGDNGNNRIRKINTAGIISTIAGNGSGGYSGDGGQAISGEVSSPAGITLDVSGNVYVADYSNHRIRKLLLADSLPITVQNVICNGNNTGSASVVGLAGGTSPYTYSWSSGGVTNATASNLSAGTYSVYITDNHGCSATVSATITEPPHPVGVSITSVNNVLCYGATGSLTATPNTVAIAPYTFSWSPFGGSSSTATVGAGTYVITMIDGRGCTATASATITEPAALGSQVNYTITTIAGNGTTGYSGDGGAATAAELFRPSYTAIDGLGNIYISDHSNYRIRKINTAGIITTIAGNGTAGYSGDNIAATAAELNNPGGIAVDYLGNVYIADYFNDRIREVNTSGIITTIAGGTEGYNGDNIAATAAELDNPSDVKVDGLGNVYIADLNNNRIRKINTSGIITTIAGNGYTSGINGGYSGDGGPATAAELSWPNVVCLDGNNNVYIADNANNCIRKINTAGTITTIAGNGSQGYSGDGAAATSAELNSPSGIVVDGSGNVYIGDISNNRVREVNTSGTIFTIAGNGTGGYYGDGGAATSAELNDPGAMSLDGSGNIYFGDVSNDRIRKLAPGGGLAITVQNLSCNGNNTGSASLTGLAGGTPPYTYSWSPGGGANLTASNLSAGTYTVYITDNHGCMNSATATITQPASAPAISISSVGNILCNGGTGNATANAATGGTSPYTYSWSGGGGTNIAASNLSAGTYTITATDYNGCTATASATITEPTPLGVLTYTISTIAGTGTPGYNGDNIAATSANLSSYDVITDGAGNIYIADHNNNRIRKISTGGIITTIAGNGTSGYSGDGGAATSAKLSNPLGIALDNSGNLYIADNFNQLIRKVNTNGIISTIAGNENGGGNGGYSGDGGAATSAELNNPFQVKVDPLGNVYIADGSNNRIRKINSSGIITTIAGTGGAGYNGDNIAATSAELNSPNALALDGLGNIYIADDNNYRIRKVNTAGIMSTIAGNGTVGYNGDNIAATSAELNSPEGLAIDGSGNVYFADVVNMRVRQVNTAGIISTIAGNGYYVNFNGGYSGDGGAATLAELNYPGAVAVDGSGNVYISDGSNYRIRKLLPGGSLTITVQNLSCGGNNSGSASVVGLIGGTPPYTYSWSPGGATNATASNLSAGTYTVYITDNHGCANSATATLTQPVSTLGIAISSVTQITCSGGTGSATAAIATGGNSPYTYSWSGSGQTTLTAISLIAGTYTITVTDHGGCTAITAATVTQPAPFGITISSVQNASCGGGSITANTPAGGTSPYTYTWIPSGGSGLRATNLSAGTYTLITLDNNGCDALASATISQTSSPFSVTAAITTNITCHGGSNGAANASTSGGSSPYTYSWSNSATSASITGLSAGTYTITVHDFNGCTATAYIGIAQPSAVAANAVVSTAISCNGGASGQAKVTATGGYSPYTYSWSPGTSSTYSSTGLSAGIYSITITDRNGCTGTSTVTLTQPAAIRDSLASVSYPTCTVSTGSATIGVKGGTSPYRYTWTPNVSTTATATGLTVRGYVVIVKDLNGCTSTITFSISQPPVLRDSIVKASISYVTCGLSNNGSATVGIKYGTSPYTYSWNPTGNTTANASGLSVGTYTVTVQDANTCSATASVTISQAAGLTLSAIVTANITCNGSANAQAKVTVTGGVSPYTYSWSPNSGSTYLVTGLSAGTFTITVKDKNGCTNSTSVTVSQPAAIRDSVASITYPVSHGGTGSATIGVKGGTSPYRYSWTPNVSTTATGTGLTARTYTVQVKDANGCYNNVIFVITQPSTSVLAGKPVHKNALTGETDSLNYCCPDNINLYPNPNSGQFTITGIEKGMLIEVYDYTGRKISSIRANDITMQLNISNESNGIYLIRIIDKDGNLVSHKKVMKVQ